jgi:hypothetical protein
LITFFIDSKHPPSLTFLLFNMSWSLVLLVLLKAVEGRLKTTFVGWILTTLGQTALFFFVAHMLLYRVAAALLGEYRLVPFGLVANSELLCLWVECALSMVILVPLCAAYRNLRRKFSILSYL